MASIIDNPSLPVEIVDPVVYPKVVIPAATNLNIDNTTKYISGLNDDTTYNVRAVIRNNATGKAVVINRVLDQGMVSSQTFAYRYQTIFFKVLSIRYDIGDFWYRYDTII